MQQLQAVFDRAEVLLLIEYKQKNEKYITDGKNKTSFGLFHQRKGFSAGSVPVQGSMFVKSVQAYCQRIMSDKCRHRIAYRKTPEWL